MKFVSIMRCSASVAVLGALAFAGSAYAQDAAVAEDEVRTVDEIVVTAGFDPLKDEGRAYAEKLAAAGVTARHVEHAGFVHDFYVLGHVCPKVFDVIDETAEALKAGLA